MNRVPPLRGDFLRRVAAIALIAGVLATIGAWPAAVQRIGTSTTALSAAWQTPSVIVPIGGQVAGKVVKVDVGAHRRVAAGAVLIELDPAGYRAALSQARARAMSLADQVKASQAGVATRRNQVAAGVTAAVGSASSMPPLPALPPVAVPKPDAGTTARLAQAQQQIVAARTEVLHDAESEAASARQTVDRDRALLAQGFIAAQQLDGDTAAYNAALSQVSAARADLRNAHAGTAGGSVAQAEAAIATAQHKLGAVQAEADAASRTVDRDSALAAQGALAAGQVAADTVRLDAARARVQAATAELHRAQASLTAAQAEAAAVDAARGQTDILQQAQAARAQHAARTQALAQQAVSTIATAAQGAQALAGLEMEVVKADIAVRRAEADLAATVVRAPADGWVVQAVVGPGDSVRQGQSMIMFGVDARQEHNGTTAASLQPKAPVAPVSSMGSGSTQLAQIAEREHRVLAELSAEATRISSISRSALPNLVPRGASLPLPQYGSTDALNQASGTGPTLLNGGMPWPVIGPITSGYGWRIHPIFDAPEFHTGVDIAASMGTAVDAPAPGTVIFAGSLPANGTLVILDHGHGITTTYSHLSSYHVYIGEHVRRGQVIALVGSTGWSTGPHLFFEIRKNGRPINPLSQ